MSTEIINLDAAQRHDLYYAVHKGIRLAHCKLLVELGAFDFESAQATADIVAKMRTHLHLCGAHLKHENAHIHTALDLRAPGASDIASEGHEGHEHSFVELDKLIDALATSSPVQRQAAARALYARFALFVADDIEHMNEEETVLQPALEAVFSDDELRGIEANIVAGISPDVMALFMAPMVAAQHPRDRFLMLEGMKAGMPQDAFAAMMEHTIKPNLSASDWEAIEPLRA